MLSNQLGELDGKDIKHTEKAYLLQLYARKSKENMPGNRVKKPKKQALAVGGVSKEIHSNLEMDIPQ